MNKNHLNYLTCPNCESKFDLVNSIIEKEIFIISGDLVCSNNHLFPIVRGIPRFIPSKNYSNNFGIQWNFFDKVQLDKFSKNKESKKRYDNELSYNYDWKKNKILLEVGCGAGRFLEYSIKEAKLIVGVDLSNSVDAVYKNFYQYTNLLLVQADLYNLPFKKKLFDGIYSIGVIQHTPDPVKSIKTIMNYVKKNGVFGFTMYEKKKWTLFNGKYVIRHITKHLPPKFTLLIIVLLMPILFPLTQLFFKIPFFGKILSFIIPVCDYTKIKDLSLKDRYMGVLLDTFDMLAPSFDKPLSKNEVRSIISNKMKNIVNNEFNYKASGINVVGEVD